MYNSSSSYRFAPRFDDDDGINLDCNPKVVKITSSQPISIDVARDGLLNFIHTEKEKDYSSSQRRRLDRLFHIINGIPVTDSIADENNKAISNQTTLNIPSIERRQQNTNNNDRTTSIINMHDETTTTRNVEEMQVELVESVQDLRKKEEEKKKAKKEKKEAKKAKKAAKKEKKEKKSSKTKKEST